MNKVFTELYFVTIIWLFKEHILIRVCSSVLGKDILVRYSVIVAIVAIARTVLLILIYMKTSYSIIKKLFV